MEALRAEGWSYPDTLQPHQARAKSTIVHSSDCNTNASILQEDAIKLILSGKHVVLNIPTGGGKSFPQMAANIFAEGEKFFISNLKKKRLKPKSHQRRGRRPS